MKTITTLQLHSAALPAREPNNPLNEKSRLRIVFKSDLRNHHFAQHGNMTVQDAGSWDQSWFANYE
jgi:hypothetical protein